MQINTKTCTQRRSQQATTGSSSHHRKRIQINLNAPCRRAFIYHDINAVILHRRVQVLFHHRRKAVNFIDKQHIIRFQTGKHSRQITRFIKHRTGSNFKTNSQFIRNNIGKCRFSQSRRSMQQYMIQRLSTQAGCLNKDTQIIHHLILPAEIFKGQRTKCVFKIAFPTSQLIIAYVKIFSFHSIFSSFLIFLEKE